MEKGTSLPSSTAEHLEPEVLAAFLDGELSEDENREVRRHLAECEECHQVFVDAATFLREEETTEGTVSPFAEPTPSAKPPAIARHRPWRQNVAVAATVVLAIGTGTFGHQWSKSSKISVPGLTQEDLQSVVHRGVEAGKLPARELAFNMGAKSVELLVQIEAGRGVKDQIDDLLAGAPASLRKLRPKTNDREAAERLLHDLRAEVLDPDWFDLGQWAQAGSAAAGKGQSALFKGWAGVKYRRVLARLLKGAREPLPAGVLKELQNIDDLLDAPQLNFSKLKESYDKLLKSAENTAPSGQPQRKR